ncbi:pyruvate dehydrogenase (acetyl-transferring) E1 component subunit alpha, partial [Streptomyces sp. SA15]
MGSGTAAATDSTAVWRPGADGPLCDPAPLLPDPAPVRVLGTPAAGTADPGWARALYERLVVGRRFNEQGTALARQGRLAVYPSSTGQEAC